MVVPDDNRLEGDAMLFLNEMRPDFEAMLQEELIRQHGIKYTLVLTVELEKLALSVGQVYDDNSKSDIITSFWMSPIELLPRSSTVCIK